MKSSDERSPGTTPINDGAGSLRTRSLAAQELQAYAPYSAMPEGLLIEILAGARLRYCAAGDRIAGPDDGIPAYFGVVQQGLIQGSRLVEGDKETVFEAGPGETFLHTAMFDDRAPRTELQAIQDSFVIEIPRSGFDRLLEADPGFRDFCERRASQLVDESRRRLRFDANSSLQDGASLDAPVAALLCREPVVCDPTTPVLRAVQRMHAARVGSIVVVDEERRPVGIFTLHDLRELVARDAYQPEQPVAGVMTQNPLSLDHRAPAFEAAMTMVQYGFGHVPVTTGGRLSGVVSERDLFALQRVNIVHLMHRIGRAATSAELAEIRLSNQTLVETMLAQGASARQLTRLITQINDSVVRRVVALEVEGADVPDSAFVWLAFGSEARGEQAVATDQDNGLLFEAPDGADPESLRTRWLTIARRCNTQLDRVGFPLCRGNIMAGNRNLCLTTQEWERKYEAILRSSTPRNLLDATILFDLRAVVGDAGPVEEIRRQISREAGRNTRFQHALAQHALEWRPPLGTLGGFITGDGREGQALDLKKGGLQIFVAAARVLALANGVLENNTEDRLLAVADVGAIPRRDAEAWAEAFSFIQLLRMRGHHDQLQNGRPFDNLLIPGQLNPLDRRILKEALRQAKRLQTRLRLNYS